MRTGKIKYVRAMFIILTLGLIVAPDTTVYGSIITGDWQQVHQSINQAFTKNSPGSTTGSFGALGLIMLLAAILLGILLVTHQRLRPPNSGSMHKASRFSGSSPNRQKRNWVRVPAGLDFLYTPISNGTSNQTAELKKARILDISAGGLLFISKCRPEINEILTIILKLPPHQDIRLTGKVVRISDDSDNNRRYFMVGVEYMNPSKTEQDQIIKWISARQQELITKKNRGGKDICISCGKPLPRSASSYLVYCPRCLAEAKAASPEEPTGE